VAIDKTDKSFKILINKKFTTDQREFYQEAGADTLNMHKREIWMDDVSENSASAISSGVAQFFDKFILSADPTFGSDAFYFCSGSGFVPGTSVLSAADLINSDSASLFQTDFISDKYGSDYELELYDDTDTRIYKTDAINWIFDYKTGILHVADAGSYVEPYKVTLFQYTGKVLSDSGSIDSVMLGGSVDSASYADYALSSSYAATASYLDGQTSGLWTGSDGYISRESDVEITGSLDVTGLVDIDNGITINKLISIDNSFRYMSGSVAINGMNVAILDNNLTLSHTTLTTSTGLYAGYDQIYGSITEGETNTRPFSINVSTGKAKFKGIVSTGSIDIIKGEVIGEVNLLTIDDGHFILNGNQRITGSIYISDGETVDGVDISEFSSSVENRLVTVESGSSKWTLEDDGSISRDSDVQITGSLNVSSIIYADSASIGKYEEGALLVNYSRSFPVWAHSGLNQMPLYAMQEGLIYSPGTIIHPVFRAIRANVGGNVTDYTAPVFEIRNQDDTSESDNFIISSGDSPITTKLSVDYYGNTFISGSVTLPIGETVDGVDISEFSSSVATNLASLNIITGSYWTGSITGITREGNVEIDGDLDVTGILTAQEFHTSFVSVLMTFINLQVQ